MFGKIMDHQKSFIDNESSQFLNKNIAKNLCNFIIPFTNDFFRNRFMNRIDKIVSKNNQEDPAECIDIDHLMDIFIEEYFDGKKRLIKIYTKLFSKIYEDE